MSPSRSSMASCAPVEAPDGTAARPQAPSSRTTSTSTVGLPRLSRISRPMMSTMAVMSLPLSSVSWPLACWRPFSLYHPPPKADHVVAAMSSLRGSIKEQKAWAPHRRLTPATGAASGAACFWQSRSACLCSSCSFSACRYRARLPRVLHSLASYDADAAARQLCRRVARVLRLQPVLLRPFRAADRRSLAGADAAARRCRRVSSPARPQDPLRQARRRPAGRPHPDGQGEAVDQRAARAHRGGRRIPDPWTKERGADLRRDARRRHRLSHHPARWRDGAV